MSMLLRRILFLFVSLFFINTLSFAKNCALCESKQPKLVIEIIVDQFREDYLTRYYDKFSKNGFRYLLDQGIWYTNANHPHANTTTVVGHSTISTGTYPAMHGMIANKWYDRQLKRLTYCVEDLHSPIVRSQQNLAKKKFEEGRSPKRIIASTLSDELRLASSPQAKIYAVSLKDRSAISLAGHAGKAFWFDRSTGQFVSSHYYYPSLPHWVNQWNQAQHAEKYASQSWNLMHDKSYYSDTLAKVFNPTYLKFTKQFPHPFGQPSDNNYYRYIATSPAADELTLSFAKSLFNAENLADSSHGTSFLGISFSATDKIGHNYGPRSIESEDEILQLDRSLGQLFQFIDQQVGLDNTLIVLSSDHGVTDMPQSLRNMKISAGRVKLGQWMKHALKPKLKQRFNTREPLIAAFANPYLYLDDAAIKRQGLDKQKVTDFIIGQLNDLQGIYAAISSIAIANNSVVINPVTERVRRNYLPQRSGDIYVVTQPYWFISEDRYYSTISHGAPWRYDTNVPVIFAGNGLKPQRVDRMVETIDIAPTLAALLNTRQPSASVGIPLKEVLASHNAVA